MGIDRKKLQNKKAKKSAKNKARKTKQKKHANKMGNSENLLHRQALQSPIHECFIPENLFSPDLGMGKIIVSRKSPVNEVLVSVFLVDVFCLGIKDSFIYLLTEEDYISGLMKTFGSENLKTGDPACARKIVEEAVDYANNLGFSPDKNYNSAKKIFRDIDVNNCTHSFEFGKDGKPYFMSGPNDSEIFCWKVINQLNKKCGADGYHFLTAMSDPFED